MMQIPTRFIAKCELCSRELNTQADGVHQWVAGWVKNRSGGGGHGISLAQAENRWAHGQCVERKIKGYDKQFGMFPR